MYTIEYRMCPNTDFGPGSVEATFPRATKTYRVEGYEAAIELGRRLNHVTEAMGGGSSNGFVTIGDDAGKMVARVSWNGRLWDTDDDEIPVVDSPPERPCMYPNAGTFRARVLIPRACMYCREVYGMRHADIHVLETTQNPETTGVCEACLQKYHPDD